MIIDELFESPQQCPECGGISFSDLILAEKKDACYYKVKASAKVWPSAYASGRLVQCRKKGAANYGNKSEGVAEGRKLYKQEGSLEKWINDAESAGHTVVHHKGKTDPNSTHHAISKDGRVVGKFFNATYVNNKRGFLDQQGVAEGLSEMDNRTPSGDREEQRRNRPEAKAKQDKEQQNRLKDTSPEMRKKLRLPEPKEQGVAEQQELDEKWSAKYKSSINCANPKGFSQKAHCAGRKKNEDVEESLGKQIHSTFQTMGDSFSDAHLAKGISYFLQGRHQEGENWLRGKIPPDAQAAVFGKLKTLQAQGGVDVNKNPNVQQYIDDKLVPWVKNQIQQNVKESTGQPLSVQQLATISDAALDDAYGYGRSTPGNTFGWQANLKSAAYAKQMIDQGVTDIEAISDAIHKGWNTTAQAFVQNPDQFDDTAKLAAAGKLEAKLQQRAQLMKQNYAQLPEEEKEKDRVVARALLQAIRGEQQQGVAEGKVKLYTDPSYFGAEVDDAGFDSLPVVNIPTNRLVGFEPDSKMQQPKAMANVKNILAGLEQGNNIPPILVRKYKNGYQVLDGHHRFWAYKVAKKDTIPARVVDPKDIEEFSKQGVAEGSELKQAKRKYNQAAKDANADQVGAGKKIDTMKNSLRQKDINKQSVAEAQTDYQKRRQRERDVDAGKPVKPEPKNPQNDYFARRKKERDMAEGVMHGAEELNVGDPVVITGNVEFEGKTGDIVDFGQDKRFVVVNLYNHGRQSFHSSDVSYNDYAGSDDMNADDHDDDMAEAKKQPPEAKYDDQYDAMVARVQKLAGIGPMKTVYDPDKRVYKNVPTAVQPKR